MAAPHPEEEEEAQGACPGMEVLTRDQEPTFLRSLATATLDYLWPFVKPLWERWPLVQTVSPSSPPASQAQARQENELPKEENQEPNEEDKYVELKDFTIQVRVTGRTGDCEKGFLKDLTGLLYENEICLKAEDYQEDSGHFLLVFCPVASRVGTDMQNAMEGLQGEPKAVLIMLHHRPKEYDHFLDTTLQAQHPAVVRTVHARYTLESGLYDCQMNEEAVAAVAEVLKDNFKEEQEASATLGPEMESGVQTCLE